MQIGSQLKLDEEFELFSKYYAKISSNIEAAHNSIQLYFSKFEPDKKIKEFKKKFSDSQYGIFGYILELECIQELRLVPFNAKTTFTEMIDSYSGFTTALSLSKDISKTLNYSIQAIDYCNKYIENHPLDTSAYLKRLYFAHIIYDQHFINGKPFGDFTLTPDRQKITHLIKSDMKMIRALEKFQTQEQIDPKMTVLTGLKNWYSEHAEFMIEPQHEVNAENQTNNTLAMHIGKK